MRLKYKLIFGGLGIVMFIMTISTAVVAYFIYRQNKAVTNEMLRNAMNIMRYEFSVISEKLAADSRQAASAGNIGTKIKYLLEEKSRPFMTKETYIEVCHAIYEIGMVGNMWKVSVYDIEGDLVAFMKDSEESCMIGYPRAGPEPGVVAGTLKPNEKPEYITWHDHEAMGSIPLTYHETIPHQEQTRFESAESRIYLTAFVPVTAAIYNSKIQKLEQRQVAVIKTARLIDAEVIKRISRLTRMKINLFSQTGLVAGQVSEYTTHDLNTYQKNRSSDRQNDWFDEVVLEKSSYYQGVIPLYRETECIGAVSLLYSKETAQASTRRMIRILILITGLCILGIIPFAVFMAKNFTDPLTESVRFAVSVSKGDLSSSIDIDRKDEIGDLAHAMKQMKLKINEVLNDTNKLIESVREGRLDTRGNERAYCGAWRELVAGVNNLAEAFAVPFNVTSSYIDRISAGDIPEKIADEYKGDFNKIKDNLNLLTDATQMTTQIAEEIAGGNLSVQVTERSENDRMMKALNRMIRRLNEIMSETRGMIQAVGQGRLDVRGNAEAFQGGWRELVAGVNSLIDGLRSAVSEKVALSHEMQLARRIQTSLLPTLSHDFHPDFDIAAAMVPADAVGGDFYDITYDRTGNLWIAVGDVSGHGVTPGLIMMMAQTVHATVTASMDCDSRNVVITVNKILYKNVSERLHESHFMTFTALKYLGGGVFQHAGAHLSMIVFRGKTGACELVRTKGVYLNFKKDISRATKNSEFRLEPGDILVLYTDGLTEAMNHDGELLDIDRFINIIETHARQDAETMKDMIMADVIQWCGNARADDMTLVIMKRKNQTDGHEKQLK